MMKKRYLIALLGLVAAGCGSATTTAYGHTASQHAAMKASLEAEGQKYHLKMAPPN